MSQQLFHVAGFPNVLGTIDGTLVPIKRPSVDEHLYVCRKGYSACQASNRHIQTVADADYKCINIVDRWPGVILTTGSYGAIVI